eukprot:2767599-Rhodomonas_salina.1
MSATDQVYVTIQCPLMLLCNVRYRPSVCCYAVSGTEVAYGAMYLLWNVLPGYARGPRGDGPRVCCYTMSGTDLAYSTTQYLLLA